MELTSSWALEALFDSECVRGRQLSKAECMELLRQLDVRGGVAKATYRKYIELSHGVRSNEEE